MSEAKTKTCSKCGGNYDAAVFFRRNDLAYTPARSGSRPICIGCEQNDRDETKRRNRWLTKARDALRGHARKLGFTTSELADTYGWSTERMAHEAEHAYDNGCPECGDSFRDMGHGLADITLDVIDPQSPPIYGMNTRWICMTCNRAKGRTSLALRAAKHLAWAQWREQQERLSADPWKDTLLEGSGYQVYKVFSARNAT